MASTLKKLMLTLQPICGGQSPRNLKWRIGSLFDPRVNAVGGGHIARHVWSWVIVSSDLAQSFGTICAHYHTVWFTMWWPICVCDLSPRRKANSRLTKLFGGLSYEKIQRFNNLPPYVTARWSPQQIPPLKFPWQSQIFFFIYKLFFPTAKNEIWSYDFKTLF